MFFGEDQERGRVSTCLLGKIIKDDWVQDHGQIM